MNDEEKRQRAIEQVQAIGNHIAENAENIVGDYLNGVFEIEIKCLISAGEVPTIDVKRSEYASLKVM